MKSTQTINNGNAVYTILNNDFLFIRRAEDQLDFSKSQENLEEIRKRLEPSKYFVLINNTGFDYYGKTIREVLDECLTYLSKAIPLVAEQPEDEGVVNLFISLSKSNVPMKSFRSEEEGIKWLNTQVKLESRKITLENLRLLRPD
jgi:hypothetical protein